LRASHGQALLLGGLGPCQTVACATLLAASRSERDRRRLLLDTRRTGMSKGIGHDLRIIAANVGGAREAAEIGGSGLLRGGQAGQIAQIGAIPAASCGGIEALATVTA
jgi:hypothetical protein